MGTPSHLAPKTLVGSLFPHSMYAWGGGNPVGTPVLVLVAARAAAVITHLLQREVRFIPSPTRHQRPARRSRTDIRDDTRTKLWTTPPRTAGPDDMATAGSGLHGHPPETTPRPATRELGHSPLRGIRRNNKVLMSVVTSWGRSRP